MGLDLGQKSRVWRIKIEDGEEGYDDVICNYIFDIFMLITLIKPKK